MPDLIEIQYNENYSNMEMKNHFIRIFKTIYNTLF